MTDFLFYPRSRIAGIGENNEEKLEKSIVKKWKKNIDIEKADDTKTFISKKKKNGAKK